MTLGEIAQIDVFTKPGYYFVGAYDSAEGGTKYFDGSGRSTKAWDARNPKEYYARFESISTLAYSGAQYKDAPQKWNGVAEKYITFEFPDEFKRAISENPNIKLALSVMVDISCDSSVVFKDIDLKTSKNGGETIVLGENEKLTGGLYKTFTYWQTVPTGSLKSGEIHLCLKGADTSSANDYYYRNVSLCASFEVEEQSSVTKKPYCQYDSSVSFESAQGGLRLFIPTYKGYINYNFVHTVSTGRNADIWRLGLAYACDDDFKNSYPITTEGAEWDMALKLSGRDDFIGGYAHGDEKSPSLSMKIDGKSVDIKSLTTKTSFNEIIITEESIGYDPANTASQALKHYKEYIINKSGITLNQSVEWLNSYTLETSHMAMMPPLKTLTDTFYTNVDNTPKPTESNYGTVSGATMAVVYGSTSNISFSMSVPKYLNLQGGRKFLLTDNGNNSYNKMYLVLCNGASASKGDVWESTTQYSITNK